MGDERRVLKKTGSQEPVFFWQQVIAAMDRICGFLRDPVCRVLFFF